MNKSGIAVCFALLGLAVGWMAHRRTAPPEARAPTVEQPVRTRFDASLEYITDTDLFPASDGSGDYLLTDRGIWLLRGTEAVRVTESPSFSSPMPTTLPQRTLVRPDTLRIHVVHE